MEFFVTSHTAQSKVEYLAEPVARDQNTKAVEFLTLAGFTLHSNDWIVPLAIELNVNPDEIRNRLTGETPLTMDDAVWPKVLKALRERREKLSHLHDEVHSAFQEANELAWRRGDQSKIRELPAKPLHILR
jgi:hypothetical protein